MPVPEQIPAFEDVALLASIREIERSLVSIPRAELLALGEVMDEIRITKT